MNPELRRLIDRTNYHQGTVRAMAALLPADDAELDALILETLHEGGVLEFHFVVMAALGAGRSVDARHLVPGILRIPDANTLGLMAWNMKGDVPEHLLAAMRSTRLRPEFEAVALLIIVAWCQERREGKLPEDFMVVARTFARRKDLEIGDEGMLMAIVEMTRDAGLAQVFAERARQRGVVVTDAIREAGRRLGEASLCVYRKPIMDLIPAAPLRLLTAGGTMRRPVARVGRNEPCPCGSGKKYKHCCHDHDQDRLHHSTHVAGVTEEELRTDPERYLTEATLPQSGVYDLLRYNPAKIPVELRILYLAGLAAYKQFDRAAEAFEQLGCPEELKDMRKRVLWEATKAGHRASIPRLMRVPPALTDDDVHLSTGLLLVEDDPAQTLKFLQTASMESLLDDEPGGLEGFATGLLLSKLRPVGIFVARGLMPFLPRKHAVRLLEEVLKARDQLNLPPDDPCGDLLDQRFLAAKPDGGKEAAALREAQGRLGAKLQEVQELKEALARMQKEVARRETRPAPLAAASPPTVSAAAVDERALQDLRQKVEGLKSALKERHQERNSLRRELQKAHEDLEALRQAGPVPAAGRSEEEETAGSEEDWLLPEEMAGNQPVRVIEFPRRFQEALASLPRSVSRGTLTMLGRLAAGEPAAFVGAVRLKACPSVMRQRIGIDFRLLFRLLPDRVQVVDLIPRQDLERKIKTLI